MRRHLPSLILTLFALFAFFASPATAFPAHCNKKRNVRKQYILFKRDVTKLYKADPPVVGPGLLRLAFHDCITATANKSNSGCNGSIRLPAELNRPANNRLNESVERLRPLIEDSSRDCISWADGILYAAARVTKMMRGGNAKNVVNMKSLREDVNEEDYVDLPSATWPYATAREFYKCKGFSEKEFVVSLAGGHSVGRFTRTEQLHAFTPLQSKIDSEYSINLHLRNLTCRLPHCRNAPGFNTLPIDNHLVGATEENGLDIIATYAGGQQYTKSKGNARIKKDFPKFLLKLSKLNGDVVAKTDCQM